MGSSALRVVVAGGFLKSYIEGLLAAAVAFLFVLPGIGAWGVSLILCAGSIAHIAFTLASGFLVRRLGVRRVMTAAAVLPIVAVCFYVLPSCGIVPLAVGNAIKGCSFGILTTVSPLLIVEKTEVERRGRSSAFFQLSMQIGPVVGALFGAGAFLKFTRCRDIRIVGAGADVCGVRMWRDDYADKTKYEWSEWRHALSFLSCENVSIEGISANESGGDGLYIGRDGRSGGPCRDFTVKNCVFDRNYRQGVSVISVDGLLMDNVRMTNTKGTAPEAGVDFEPNAPDEILRNVVMRNCVCEGNHGRGIDMELVKFDGTTAPLSVLIENCRATANSDGFRVSLRRGSDWPSGNIAVRGCTFEKSRSSGLLLMHKPAGTVGLSFLDCAILDNGVEDHGAADIFIGHIGNYKMPTDGIVFDNVSIRQTAPREWMSGHEFDRFPREITGIVGTVDVTHADGWMEKVKMDSAWLKEHYPVRLTPPLMPSVRFDPAAARVVDNAPDKSVALSTLRFRGRARYVFFASKAGEYSFRGEVAWVGKLREAPPSSVSVLEYPSGKKVCDLALSGIGNFDCVAKVPGAGFYVMDFALRNCFAYRLLSSTVPIGVMVGEGHLPVWNSVGKLFFRLPVGGGCDLAVIGSASERIAAKVSDSDGNVVWSYPAIGGWEVFHGKSPGLYSVTFSKPSAGIMDDYGVNIFGVAPILFLSSEKYW